MENVIRGFCELGLTMLANTSSVYPGAWFMGHTGAAVLAGALLKNDLEFSAATAEAVDKEMARLANADAALANSSVEASPPGEQSLLVQQMQECLTNFSADAHGVIFGALTLRALALFPELATQKVIAGVCAVLQDSLQDDPARYIGIHDYYRCAPPAGYLEELDSVQAAAVYSLTRHNTVYPDAVIQDKLNFLAGDQLHLVTHAQALLDLQRSGYAQLAELGLPGLRKHFYLIEQRAIPETQTAYNNSGVLNPKFADFWLRGKTDPHHLKLAYAVLSINDQLPGVCSQRMLADISTYWELLP